jgi:hypothetical protein
MMRLLLLAAVTLFGAGFTAAAETPVLDTALLPPEIPYHRTALYTVSVEADPEVRISFPEITGDPGKVEVEKSEYQRDTLADGRVRHIQNYRVNPIVAGVYALPPLPITWQDNAATGTLTAPPAAFNARDLTPAEAKSAEIFLGITAPDAVLSPQRHSGWLILVGAGVLLVVAAILLVFLTRRRHMGDRTAPSLPAWEIALNRLRELQQRDLPGVGKLEAFYVDLSAILRYYIEDRFQIQAPEQTTPEFIEAASKYGVFSEAQETFLADFLRQCDRIKFARLQPGVEEAEAHFTQVRLFIKETIPEEATNSAMEHAA